MTYLTWTGEMEAPDLPVNEAELEGCPDHPAIAAAFGVVWRPESATTEGPPPEPGWPVTLLQVPWHDGPVHVNRVNYRIVRGRSDRWEDLSEDVRVIRGAVVEGYQPHDGDTFLSSRPGTYPLAMGRPVVVYCLHAIYPGGRKFCTAAYGLTDGLSVIYKFRTPDVAERDVLRFDAHLRRFLARHQLTEEECAQLQTCGDRRWQPNM